MVLVAPRLFFDEFFAHCFERQVGKQEVWDKFVISPAEMRCWATHQILAFDTGPLKRTSACQRDWIEVDLPSQRTDEVFWDFELSEGRVVRLPLLLEVVVSFHRLRVVGSLLRVLHHQFRILFYC